MANDRYKQALPLMNLGGSRPPNLGDTFANGFSVGSVWTYLSDTYNCTGDGIWELIGVIPPLNNVLSVGNDAVAQQIKNIGDATEETDAMSYGQFLRGLAGLTSYFFSSTNSDIATYESMPDLANYTSAAEADNGGVVVSTTPTSLGKFATNSGFPNVTKIPIGLFSAHVEVQKGAGSNNYATFFKLYKRNLAGTETLLVTSDYSSEVSANTRQQITVSAYISDPITLLATDRIVIEWYSVMNSSTATITMYYDGSTNARFSLPVVSSSSSGFTAASVAEINTGTENAKGATPLGLEGSKYMTQYGQKTFTTASGTSTYTASLTPAITSYADGMELRVRFTSAPTGSATLNINGVGAKKIYLDSATQAVSSSFPANFETTVRYVSSLDGGAGGWLLTQFSWWTWIKTQVQTFAAQIIFSVALRINTSNAASAILGVNGNGVLAFTDNSSAVNRVEIVNAITAGTLIIRANGSDTNIPIRLESKGTGSVFLRSNASDRIEVTSTGVIKCLSYTGSVEKVATFLTDGSLSNSYNISTNYHYSQRTSNTASSNSTSELAITTVDEGAKTIVASDNYAGKVIELNASGEYSSVTTPTLTINVRFGPAATALASRTLLVTTGAIIMPASATTLGFKVVIRTTYEAIGISGTAKLNTMLELKFDNGTLVQFVLPKESVVATGIDTTVDNVYELTATWSAASASNNIVTRSAILQKIK